MFKSIVVGTDGSGTAREAVEQAARLALDHHAALHLVSAYRPPSQMMVPAIEGMMLPTGSDGEAQAAVEEMLSTTAKELADRGVQVSSYACPQGAADAIISVAEHQNADLIVVGNRGMTGTRRFLGSVPNSVAHHARCSVMIVRTC